MYTQNFVASLRNEITTIKHKYHLNHVQLHSLPAQKSAPLKHGFNKAFRISNIQ